MDSIAQEQKIELEAQLKLLNEKRNQLKYAMKKDKEEFKKDNRARQSYHYKNNPEYRQKKLDNYHNNKQLFNWRCGYNKYKRLNRLPEYIERWPDRYKFLCEHDPARYTVSTSASLTTTTTG